ncbi:MAG: TolC family protein [Spirochaetales bacterium]|nr:TolC family protein [Spirochaetales bacterium]
MIKILGVSLLLLLQLPLYGDLGELYSNRLEKNLLYIQALFKLEEAELALRQYEQNYIPSLSAATSATPGAAGYHHFGITNGELDPFTINTQLVFNNIYGSTIGLSVPYKWDNESGQRMGAPVLVFSRKLFAESGAGYLKVKAAMLENEYKIEEIRIDTGTALVRDIVTAYYSIKSEQIYSEYIDVLETALRSLKDEKERNTMKRKLYSIKKLFLKVRYGKDISKLANHTESGEIESMYTELAEITAGWEQKLNELYSPSVKTKEAARLKDIRALELYLEAAKKEAVFRFLPFLPNPTLFASLAYDIEMNQFTWGLGFSVIIPLVDHGERDLESRKRKQGAEMAQLALDDRNDQHDQTIKTIRQDLEIMKIDVDILELDREEAYDSFKEAEQLYENEIINESDYKLKKLDYELSELAVIDKKGEYYTKLFSLFAEYITDTGELFQ